MFGSNPPPLITIGTPLILNARAPLGSIAFDPVRYEVTVLTPNVSLVELSVTPPCATETPSVYSGCEPSWYGHQTCGLLIVRLANADGVNEPVWAPAVGLVTSVLTVSAALDRSAASFWFTCELPTASAPSA